MPSGDKAMIGPDLVVIGEVRNGGEVDVHGCVHGSLSGGRVIIHPGAMIVGQLTAESAEVNGLIDGRVRVRNLIAIGAQGKVRGDVRYGQLAVAPGGDLIAEVRNIPPSLQGDFEVVVRRGRSVRLTRADLLAVDVDDSAAQLVYRADGIAGGFLARAESPAVAVATFTQKDVDDGAVLFVHDGATAGDGGFEVTVTDSAGNTAGAARQVKVAVIPD